MMSAIRMADIGEEQETIELEPFAEPVGEPVPEYAPATPVEEPDRELVPA